MRENRIEEENEGKINWMKEKIENEGNRNGMKEEK